MNDNFDEELNAKVEYEFSHKYNHTLHAYIDIVGDLVAGTLLSQIMYWFSESKSTKQLRVKVFKDGKYWLAKQRSDWYDEIRITERQYDTAIKKLKDKGFVELKKYKFNSLPTIHIRPIFKNINDAVKSWKEEVKQDILSESEKPNTNVLNGNRQNVNSLGNYENSKTGITNAVSPLTGNTNIDFNNRDYSSDNTNKASTKVEVNYKALSWTSENKVVGKLPYEYTQEQFDDFIKNKVDEILRQHSTEYQEEVNPISQIISYFYEKYYEVMGERHPIMSDAVYLGVVKKLLNPIDAIWESDTRLDVLGYEAMIDRFFATKYGEKSGNCTDYRIGYFFSDKVIENLYYRELY